MHCIHFLHFCMYQYLPYELANVAFKLGGNLCALNSCRVVEGSLLWSGLFIPQGAIVHITSTLYFQKLSRNCLLKLF